MKIREGRSKDERNGERTGSNGREKGVEDRVRLAMAPNAIGRAAPLESRRHTNKTRSFIDTL